MMQILAKLEEGNMETHRRMENMQKTMVNMETIVKSVMDEQGEFRKWKPEVEAKVQEIADVLITIQGKVDRFIEKQSVDAPSNDALKEDSVPAPTQLGAPSGEAVHGQVRHRTVDPYRRSGTGSETTQTPPPVGGTVQSMNHGPMQFEFGSFGKQSVGRSMGGWSHGSGSRMPGINFTVFDGSNPKLWKHRCETYFEFYFVPMERWIGLATMHFEGSALFWLQSIESRIREMNWEELCPALTTRFGRDQHIILIRQFYHIQQNSSVGEYIELFDQLVHQLLAHENQLTPTMITTTFIDGLRDEIKSVIVIQRPPNLNTACTLALLQEDVLLDMGRRDGRKMKHGAILKPNLKPHYSSSVPLAVTAYQGL
jgi:hypothetical protein